MNISLAQLTRTRGGPVLLLDTASSRIQTALFLPDCPALWETRDDEAGVALFTCVEKLLARASLAIADIAAFVFCDGPGSVLGIRTAAVALRTWRVLGGNGGVADAPGSARVPRAASGVSPDACLGLGRGRPSPHAGRVRSPEEDDIASNFARRPVYSYCSLTLLAHHLLTTENARNLSLIADARRDTWHHVGIGADGGVSALCRVPTAQLALRGHGREHGRERERGEGVASDAPTSAASAASAAPAAPATLAMPEHFRHWTPLPPGVRIVPYALETIFHAPASAPAPALADAPLFAPAPEPDAFLHEEPVYQTWTPRVHQAG